MLGNQASSDNAACCRMWQIVAGWAFPGRVIQAQRLGGYFDNLRCSERRWMPRSFAACEMLPEQSDSTRWRCSHSTLARDGTVVGMFFSEESVLRSRYAANICSASAGLLR